MLMRSVDDDIREMEAKRVQKHLSRERKRRTLRRWVPLALCTWLWWSVAGVMFLFTPGTPQATLLGFVVVLPGFLGLCFWWYCAISDDINEHAMHIYRRSNDE